MQTVTVQQSTVEERKNIAREQSALFPTKLALARWTSGAELPHLHTSHPPLRAAWLAKAQRDFQAWLDGGGFVQHDGTHAAHDRMPPANDPGARPDDQNRETWAL